MKYSAMFAVKGRENRAKKERKRARMVVKHVNGHRNNEDGALGADPPLTRLLIDSFLSFVEILRLPSATIKDR
ncbi:hypothetical protein L195_g022925 [Trifolium pratense]|uniref:Uncharacterized protein n=1 Tax=Trifolium pratense TaxID=57577 RepID=A0A2K3N9E4_TRIPR|nr:hypothetical protein L195_g022925 [Trifolium pratense]